MAKDDTPKIVTSVHPEYSNLYLDWEKFRYTWEGGVDFREQYLKQYSAREDPDDFTVRKANTPIPSFATAAVTDIKNSIFQRMGDITRVGGSPLYQDVIFGKLGGIDLLGATMNYFIGNQVLDELLFMGKVGVYVDMPELANAQTLNDTRNKHPYYYIYKAEDIRNWRLSRHGEFIEFDMLLLQERTLTYDDVYFLPKKDSVRYRLLTREDGIVKVRFFDESNKQIDINGEATTKPTELDIKRIPFTIFELNKSLLQNIADHQIALLNIESSDVGYILLANLPFYTEQQSRMSSPHLKSEESFSSTDDDREVEIGGTVGRSYEKGSDRPGFIHPSSEPLMASMKKQDKLKEDIRTLVQLALSAVQPKFASAEAKQFDEHGLESGLSFIGLILEHGERQLATFFNDYEDSKDIATVNYPERYSLKSDTERLVEAEKLYDIMLKLTSKTAQKAISKLIIKKLLDTKLPQEELKRIENEIDAAEYITTEPEIIHSDLEKGLVSTKTASEARGYNADTEVPKAEQDHADRIERIKAAQSNEAARGVNDLDTGGQNARDEKQDSQNTDLQDDTHKPVRGKER